MKIALLIGHRSGSQGARSVKNISEYAFWYTYLHAMLPLFPNVHTYKIFERLDSDGRGYRERMRRVGRRAGEWGAELIVSCHFNASSNAKAEGFEVLCTRNHMSKMYASMMLSAMDDNLYGDSRGVRVVQNDPRERGSGFLYKTPMPAILIEPFFGTNREDWHSALKDGNLYGVFRDFFTRIGG
jgi:hypothetical protein